MIPSKKREALTKLFNTKIELTLYGQKHIKCTPVRILGNILNFRLLGKMPIHSVNLTNIHRIEVINDITYRY